MVKNRSGIVSTIASFMTDEKDGAPPFLKQLLWALSAAYGFGVARRTSLYQKGILKTRRLPCRVISIGNLSLGGTGKTPMTIYLARAVQRMGFEVAVISRGYKGQLERSGGIVSDGKHIFCGPKDAGDEPYMMASKLERIPVLVGRNRYQMGLLALERFNSNVILLDDGFQHIQLHRDLNIILLDSRSPFENFRLFPRGRLREPPDALRRADVCIFTRSDGDHPKPAAVMVYFPDSHAIFESTHVPIVSIQKPLGGSLKLENKPGQLLQPTETERFIRKTVYAFSGIGQNNDFQKTVRELFPMVRGFRSFPDHYDYDDSDLDGLLREARDAQADILVTTEKDYARLAGRRDWPLEIAIIGIEVSLGAGTHDFLGIIETHCQKSDMGEQ